MSKKHKKNDTAHPEPVMPLNAARAEDATQFVPVPVQGDTPGPVNEAAENTDETEDAFLHRTVPFRQKYAKAFLQGKSPGVMQRYAPNARASNVEGWVEDDETVERLARFRTEEPYGG